MELAITKMSPNGQIVIPSGIRESSGISPAMKFLVFSKGKDILLKRVDEESLEGDIDLIRDIKEGEKDIEEGRFISVNKKMGVDEMDSLLME
ncbi:AbrB/MazE/SpoVT family DNA-binding domain-containing protein [archaeon]|jgi:AbrB family looped-hinge helix DNA binding protein|nr:AbrB/MazE/SpoVT family DNA-binding domain-containing protein [archaeon]